MKSEIRLNMGQLADTQRSILDYKARLQALEAACMAFCDILTNQESVSLNVLADEMKNGIIRNIQEIETRMDTLHLMLSGYVADMKGHVAPRSENLVLRVGREDIYFNIMQIQNVVDEARHGLAYPMQSSPDYRNVHIDPDSDGAEYVINAMNAESWRRKCNYQKLEAFRNTSIAAGYQVFGEALDAIWRLYNDRIVEFENTDNEYAYQAAQRYDEWRSMQNRMADLRDGTLDILKGSWDAATGMLDGLFSLASVLLSSPMSQDAFAIELPDSISGRVQDMGDGIFMMLKKLTAVLGMMNSSMTDTYAEEGMGYAISSVPLEFVIKIVGAKGVDPVVRETGSTEAGSDSLPHKMDTVGKKINNGVAGGAKRARWGKANKSVIDSEKINHWALQTESKREKPGFCNSTITFLADENAEGSPFLIPRINNNGSYTIAYGYDFTEEDPDTFNKFFTRDMEGNVVVRRELTEEEAKEYISIAAEKKDVFIAIENFINGIGSGNDMGKVLDINQNQYDVLFSYFYSNGSNVSEEFKYNEWVGLGGEYALRAEAEYFMEE